MIAEAGRVMEGRASSATDSARAAQPRLCRAGFQPRRGQHFFWRCFRAICVPSGFRTGKPLNARWRQT